MKKIRIGAFLCLMLVLLSGCTQTHKFEPTKSSIYLKKDGSATSADIETLSKTYYTQEELTAFVEEQVTGYNVEKSGLAFAYKADTTEVLPIAIEKCEIANQNATLILDFKTTDDYLAFYSSIKLPSTLFVGTIAEAKMAGYNFEGSFIKVKDGTSIGSEEASKNDKHYVAIVEGSLSVQVEGTRLYVTDKVTTEGDNTVLCVDGTVSYIIFK